MVPLAFDLEFGPRSRECYPAWDADEAAAFTYEAMSRANGCSSIDRGMSADNYLRYDPLPRLSFSGAAGVGAGMAVRSRVSDADGVRRCERCDLIVGQCEHTRAQPQRVALRPARRKAEAAPRSRTRSRIEDDPTAALALRRLKKWLDRDPIARYRLARTLVISKSAKSARKHTGIADEELARLVLAQAVGKDSLAAVRRELAMHRPSRSDRAQGISVRETSGGLPSLGKRR